MRRRERSIKSSSILNTQLALIIVYIHCCSITTRRNFVFLATRGTIIYIQDKDNLTSKRGWILEPFIVILSLITKPKYSQKIIAKEILLATNKVKPNLTHKFQK